MQNNTNKLWGAAFKQNCNEEVIKFTAGRDISCIKPADYNLLPYDILCNKAHCIMLYEQNIISKKDAQIILQGLIEIESLNKKEEFILDPSKEDVHTNIESWMIERYGIETTGKLHTARSRNDQSATDTKLYLQDVATKFVKNIIELTNSLLQKSDLYKNTPMPGFTHYQHAMITTFGHFFQAFASMLIRDAERFVYFSKLHNQNPLGSVAAYGTLFAIDQKLTTQLLGFNKPCINSLDQITNRWEAESDLAQAISVMMNHLSTLAQTLIVFTTPEFNMVKLAEFYSTGSSIMPQKKNPDSLEVIKAKASLAAGLQQSLLGIGKSNFIGYNRDSQWTKYIVMDLIEECLPSSGIVQGVVETLMINEKSANYWAQKGFIGTTSLLEKIVSEFNLPFRKAKIIIEKAVKYSEGLDDISYESLKKALGEENINIKIKKESVIQWQNQKFIIQNTKSVGGPGINQINKSSKKLKKELEKLTKWVIKQENKKIKSLEFMNKKISEIMKINDKN